MEQMYGSEPVDVVAGTVEATLRLMRVVLTRLASVAAMSPLVPLSSGRYAPGSDLHEIARGQYRPRNPTQWSADNVVPLV